MKHIDTSNVASATNSYGPLEPQMCSVVVFALGATPFVASANVPSFGPQALKAMRCAVKMYIRGARIDYANMIATRDLATVKLVANCNIKP